MTAIRPLQPIRELASRESNGIEVTLVWKRTTDELRVCVSDARSGAYFELTAEPDNALDVFHHPYSHAAFRGIPYDHTRGHSVHTTAQPLCLAA